jgi:hypothetical protein
MNKPHLASLLCFLVAAGVSAAQGSAQVPVVLANGRIRVQAWIEGGRLREDYQAEVDGQWTSIGISAAGGSEGPSTVYAAENDIVEGKAARVSMEGRDLLEEFQAGPFHVTRRLALGADPSWLHVTSVLEAAPGLRLHAFVDRFTFAHPSDWSFAPSVGGFVPDAEYKAPLILVQSGRMALGIIPDVASLDRDTLRLCTHSLDLDVPGGPALAVGFVPARYSYHSVYEPDKGRAWSADLPMRNSYYLLISAHAEPGQAYREAVRFQWSHFGRPAQLVAALQQVGTATPARVYDWLQKIRPMQIQIALDTRLRGLALWDDWRTEVWGAQTLQDWLEVPLAGGATGGGVRTIRWGPGPSVYLSAWFNTLRTSFGMALYARRSADQELLRRARQTVELALRAPGIDGAFKCIAVPAAGGGPVVWAAGDGSGDSTREGFLGYDMSWTAYWLLRWRASNLPGSEPILNRCRELAKFLCDRQSADGMLPTRFAEDGSVQADLSRQVKAETGPVALFLLELYAQDPDPRWLRAGKRGLAFMEASIIPQRQWYDFETFWSCSPRSPRIDARSQQWPANDLALGQSVAAFLAAYRVTGDRGDLAQGESLLDYLLLYQQCWTNPMLENLAGPATLLGGFTTQNSDAEWSDARQSQFGNILLDYYRATGKVEYLERGVAALRAQFPVSPCENWAHSGYGSKTGVSSFHWGTGSGMAGIEIDEDYLRDAVVDVAAAQAVGVDGLNVTGCAVESGVIRLQFSSPFAWTRAPVFAFHGCEPMKGYRIVANGTELGSWRGDALNLGIPIPGIIPK